jgi:bifunctional DNA-binding transcriptional regulator/antitoxin component of YhaV-PrlF toxin-antitoxin module
MLIITLGKPRQVDNRNRITLPREVMDRLELKPKDLVFFKRDDKKVILGKVIKRYEYVDDVRCIRR